jgi:transposase
MRKFKTYDQNQTYLPLDLDSLISANHLVRFINDTINKIDMTKAYECYPGGGTTSYNPVMMIKVLVYGIVTSVFSSRKLAETLRRDIHFMWLSGMNYPDFRTISNFRSGRLKNFLDDVFTQVLLICEEHGFINLDNYFVDGTFIEGNANRFSHVWRKNTLRYKHQKLEKIHELLKQVELVELQEDQHYGDKDLEITGDGININSVEVSKSISELNEKLNSFKPADPEQEKKVKKSKRILKQINDVHLPKLEEYEKQEEILGDRNSYSKTDNDATFMRSKQDQLLAGYNVMAGTENQIIVGFSVHQNPGDAANFTSHMDRLLMTGLHPRNIIGDSAFGSLKNYEYIRKYNMGSYLKYGYFHRNLQGKKEPYFMLKDFIYNSETDCYICKNNQELKFTTIRSDRGVNIKLYKSENCSDCQYQTICCKGTNERSLQVNELLEMYKKEAFENLTSEIGIKLRKRRGVDVETIFGDLKQNLKLRRFLLRGIFKVRLEFGLYSLAHNLKKMHKKTCDAKSKVAFICSKTGINRLNQLLIDTYSQNHAFC